MHLAARRRFAAAPVPAPAPGTNGSGTCQCRRARMDLLPEFVRGAACHSRTELGWWWWCLNGPRDGHRQQLSTPYTRSRAQGWPSTNRVIWIFGHQQPYRVASAASLPQELIGHPPNRPVAVPAVPSADAGSRRNNATPTRGGPPPLRPSQDRCSTVLHGPARSSDAPCQQRRRAIRRALTAMRCDASRVETRPGGSAQACHLPSRGLVVRSRVSFLSPMPMPVPHCTLPSRILESVTATLSDLPRAGACGRAPGVAPLLPLLFWHGDDGSSRARCLGCSSTKVQEGVPRWQPRVPVETR